MPKQVFINLPVRDLKRSVALYQALGFTINPQFSDETAHCMVWSEHIFVMLLSHEKFMTFATKPIADTQNGLAALISLSFDDKVAVDAAVASGLAAGGKEPHEVRDYGFMYQRSLEDFDGHTWELFYMDPSGL